MKTDGYYLVSVEVRTPRGNRMKIMKIKSSQMIDFAHNPRHLLRETFLGCVDELIVEMFDDPSEGD